MDGISKCRPSLVGTLVWIFYNNLIYLCNLCVSCPVCMHSGIWTSFGVGVGVLYSNTTFIRETTPLLQIRQVAQLMEHYMQPAEQSPTREEHTNNPVQKPNFRGHAGTKARTRVYKPPTVLQDHQGRENKRASVDLARGEGSGGSRQQVVVGTSLGGSLSREWTPSMPRGANPKVELDESWR